MKIGIGVCATCAAECQFMWLKSVTPIACFRASHMVLSSRYGRISPPQPMHASVLLPSDWLVECAQLATPAGKALRAELCVKQARASCLTLLLHCARRAASRAA